MNIFIYSHLHIVHTSNYISQVAYTDEIFDDHEQHTKYK